MWKEYNPNPTGVKTDDCAVRALAKVTNADWETAYIRLVMNGFAMGLMPNNNATRDSRGRYADGGMADALRDMMDNAPDESTRAEFQRFIDKIERR